MDIYFIRHGRQSSPLCNVNVPLSKEGREQAVLVGERLKGFGIQALYSSDLIRAVETAEEIGNKLHMDCRIIPKIREIDFGDWEGKTEQYLDEHYNQQRTAHTLGIEDITYPGGENGEACFLRFQEGILEIIEDGYEKVAVVTHGVALRSFIAGALGIPFNKRGLIAKTFENTSITHMTYDSINHVYRLEGLNDYAHLDGHEKLLRKYYIAQK